MLPPINYHCPCFPPAHHTTPTVNVGWLADFHEPQADLTDWPALGVQWHPEKMSEPEQRRPFEFLVIEADRYASRSEDHSE